MKRALALLVVLAVAFTFTPSTTNAQLPSQRYQEYYTDSAFTNLVGWENLDCELVYTTDGTLFTQYKILYRINCQNTQTYSKTCWQSNGSGGYTQITCPW